MPFIPTIANGQPSFPAGAPRQNPAWSSIRVTSTDGNSYYDSATVTFRRQSSSELGGQIFYTFSKAMDNTSGLGPGDSFRSPGAVLDPTNFARDWALSDFDARHALGMSFSYPVPFRTSSSAFGALVNGWTVDGAGTFTSGMPFTVTLASSVSRNLAQTLAERPNLNPGANQNPVNGTSIECPGFSTGTPVGNANHWYDPCSFSLPLAGTYGNLGRNTITGPGVANVNMALEKDLLGLDRSDRKGSP
jgi:hypothetical protein